MDNISILAAGGMRSRMDALDMLANNIANASTPGFKADREFHDLYMSADAAASEGRAAVVPDVRDRWIDFSQGTLSSTGNPTDLALAGKGFFEVESPTGPLLTRNGSFRMSAAGELETAEGYKLRSDAGQPLRLDARQPFTIAPDGSVSQSGRVVGRVGVIDVAKPEALLKQGYGYFLAGGGAGVRPVAQGTEIQQGKLEAANFSPAESAVRLVSVMRQFEMLQRAVSLGGEMNRKAVEEVARVTG